MNLAPFFNALFPLTCFVCGFQSTSNPCELCYSFLPWLQEACTTCGESCMNKQCGECLIDPPPISILIALFNYSPPLSSLITQLKYHQQLYYAHSLGLLLAQRVAAWYQASAIPLPACIIPVPLHKKRLKQRGYNQALEIAKPIKKQLYIPIDYKSAKRIVPTLSQTCLTADKRKHNLKNVFYIEKNLTVKHVAIIDDVTTTLSTIFELATALKRQGVDRVDAWCIAKAQKNSD